MQAKPDWPHLAIGGEGGVDDVEVTVLHYQAARGDIDQIREGGIPDDQPLPCEAQHGTWQCVVCGVIDPCRHAATG